MSPNVSQARFPVQWSLHVLQLAVLGVALCCAGSAWAQELTPRAYVIAPVGSNAAVIELSRLQGEVQFDGSVPITGATVHATIPALGYFRTFDLLGRTASVTLGVPYGFGEFAGIAFGVPRSFERSGLLDSSLRLAVNLVGGPAMQPQGFLRWRQKTLLGLSLKLVAPSGQYDPTRLVNWGSNHWALKPEIGYSQRWGRWLLDTYAGGWFFTTNPQFFPGTRTQSESPIGALEGHVSYDVRPRLWVSFDVNFWWGGRTSLNGIPNALTEQRSSRVGFTASMPFTSHQSLKLAYSVGAYARYGGNYNAISLAWQYSWIDGSAGR